MDFGKAWNEGNNNGEGFAVGNDGDNINEIAGIGELVQRSYADNQVAVYEGGEGYTVVGDSYGPWAVWVEKSSEYTIVYLDANGGIQQTVECDNKDDAEGVFGNFTSLDDSTFVEGDIVQMLNGGELIREFTYE